MDKFRDKFGRFMIGHPKSRNAGGFKKGHPCFNTGRTRFKKGHKNSEETKKKLSLAHIGKKLSEEHKRKIRKSASRFWLGKHRSIETKNKISISRKGTLPWNTGKPHPQKVKDKISESLKGRFSGKESPHWKGGKIIRGYVIILQPNHPSANKRGYVPEHRLVVEKYIGYYLKPKETVHHINHITSDNRPQNLMAFVNHGFHNKFAKNKHVDSSCIIFDGRKFDSLTDICLTKGEDK